MHFIFHVYTYVMGVFMAHSFVAYKYSRRGCPLEFLLFFSSKTKFKNKIKGSIQSLVLKKYIYMTASFITWIGICSNSKGKKLALARSPRRVPRRVRRVQIMEHSPSLARTISRSIKQYIIQSSRSFLVSTLTKSTPVHMPIAYMVYYFETLLQTLTRFNTRKFLVCKHTKMASAS